MHVYVFVLMFFIKLIVLLCYYMVGLIIVPPPNPQPQNYPTPPPLKFKAKIRGDGLTCRDFREGSTGGEGGEIGGFYNCVY